MVARRAQAALDRVLVARSRARDRGGGHRRGAAARARRREGAPTRPPSTPCGESWPSCPFAGRVVIGEGEMDEAPMLYIGEEVGTGEGPEVDIAVDPLEGTTICAKAMPNALAVLAISAERRPAACARHVHEQDRHRPRLSGRHRRPRRPAEDNLNALAKAKGVPVSEITACILDRPRHAELINAVRKAGAGIQLIPDGDIAGVIWTTDPEKTGIDIYLGSGGAPEGVLAAAALRCIGGQMQGRLMPLKEEEKKRAADMGITDINRKFSMHEMASGDVIFSATGVTDGSLLERRALPPGLRRDGDRRDARGNGHRPAHQNHVPHDRDQGNGLTDRINLGTTAPTKLTNRISNPCASREERAWHWHDSNPLRAVRIIF